MRSRFFCSLAAQRQAIRHCVPIGKIRRWIFLAAFCAIAVPGFADDRPLVTPDDLKMTEEPLAPGTAAIILYRQVDRNDDSEYAYENHFIRLKISKEEGRRYANIEIPYEKTRGSHIARMSARTIKPDGSFVELTDKPFDKTLLRSKGVKYMAKTFTLPDVQVGSVIEYSYLREEHDFGYTLVAENRQSSVHLSRKLSTNALILKRERYASLREFFQKVRTTDEEQILLHPANAAASN